jgi:hypothetical protein
MSERQDRDNRIHAGNQAQTFLQNPQYTKALEELYDDIYTAWVRSNPGDVDLREQLWAKQHALDDLQKRLRNPIDEGTIAAEEKKRDIFQRNLE